MAQAHEIAHDLAKIIDKWCPDHYTQAAMQTRMMVALLEANACSEAQYAVAIGKQPARPIDSFKPYREPA